MLHVVVTYKLKAENGAEFIDALESSGAAAKVREEDGCLKYEYYYFASRPAEVLLLEDWVSAEHQTVHMTQPHMETVRAIKEQYCRDTEVVFLPEGRYRHFKGNEYQLLNVALHSETQEPMVVYQALYGSRGIWVRPASMWNETVERGGRTFKRFEFVEE